MKKLIRKEIYKKKLLDEDKEAIRKSGLTEPEYRRKEALKEFGTTPYFYDAGYILPSGKMLNFSGDKGKHYGVRGNDHRSIGIVFPTVESGSDCMYEFINQGNIRIIAESPGITISSDANVSSQQISVLIKFINESKNKESRFFVDITSKDESNEQSLEYYEKFSSEKILNDIKPALNGEKVEQKNDLHRYMYALNDNKKPINIEYNSKGLTVSDEEYAKFYNSVSTEYYYKNKSHNRFQFQSCVTDKNHVIYIYRDNGFGEYKIYGKIVDANYDVVEAVEEAIEKDETDNLSRITNSAVKILEGRQWDDYVYNTYSQSFRNSNGSVEIFYGESKKSNSRKNDASSSGNGENSGETRHEKNYALNDNTKSKQFKDWFNGSKVVDENGKPLIVYHCSPNEFNTFDINKSKGGTFGRGFYFTENKISADGFSKNGNVKAFYLDIKNPISNDELTITRSQFKKLLTKLSDYTDEDGYSPLEIFNQEKGNGTAIDKAVKTEYDNADDDVSLINGLANSVDMPAEDFFNVLRNTLGYDGIIQNFDNHNEYIAFNSDQIKLADDTTYAENGDAIPIEQRYSDSDDIRYALNDAKKSELDKEYIEFISGIFNALLPDVGVNGA